MGRLMGLRAGVLAVAVVAPLASGAASTMSAGGVDIEVIVQASGQRGAAAAAVRGVGGQVTDDLPIIDGLAARLPASSLARLRAASSVLAVTPNSSVSPMATDGPGGQPGHAPTGQPYVLATGAGGLHARGLTGAHQGSAPTRVALVDTGVDTEAATRGDLQGRLLAVKDPFAATAEQAKDVACVDLSGERTCDDNYGHGTFMAGLIAGSGRASDGVLAGTAPGADILSVKIAGRTGQTDVRKILKGLQWVVSFRDRYDIGVLNLSLGTVGTSDPSMDPVNRAVQRVWDAGIVVVASAGNGGVPADDRSSTISKPGNAPLVLTVGATDDRDSADVADDLVPAYTGRGAPGSGKPDVVAPGTHLVSLRAVGSTTDSLGTLIDDTYRRGTGTSMSTAVVSGVVALIRQAQPSWTPDQVKAALRESARPVAHGEPSAIGRGLVDGPAALLVAPSDAQQPRTGSAGTVPDEQGWWTGDDWTGDDWTGDDWTGDDWTGDDWTGDDWTGDDWTGDDWTGDDWTGADWTGVGPTRSDTP